MKDQALLFWLPRRVEICAPALWCGLVYGPVAGLERRARDACLWLERLSAGLPSARESLACFVCRLHDGCAVIYADNLT